MHQFLTAHSLFVKTMAINLVLILISWHGLPGCLSKVGKTRAEADEYCARLGQAERQAVATRQELERELDQVRRELLGRLTELEPLPDALRRSELRLQETHDREHAQERQSLELSASLADLRRKVGRSPRASQWY